MSVLTDRLATSLEELRETITTSGVRGVHLISDLALLGLARDTFEHAKAVVLLWDSNVPRTAHAVARTAFEAAQEAIYLGTRDEDYDYWGARVRAGEILDWEYAAELANAAAIEEEPVQQKSASELADEDREAWSVFAPEKGSLMQTALTDVREDRQKGRFHWSGKSRAKLPKSFVEATGGNGQTELIHRSLYNLLSLHAHPAPRLESRALAFEGVGFKLHIDGDPEEIAGTAAAATVVATQSVDVVLRNKLARYQAESS